MKQVLRNETAGLYGESYELYTLKLAGPDRNSYGGQMTFSAEK